MNTFAPAQDGHHNKNNRLRDTTEQQLLLPPLPAESNIDSSWRQPFDSTMSSDPENITAKVGPVMNEALLADFPYADKDSAADTTYEPPVEETTMPHPDQSGAQRQARYIESLAIRKTRRAQLDTVAELLYLKLDWYIVGGAFPAVLVSSFHPRSINITPARVTISLGDHTAEHSVKNGAATSDELQPLLDEMVRTQIMAPVFSAAAALQGSTISTRSKEKIEGSLINLISKEIMKRSVIEFDAVFPTAAHPDRVLLPACLQSHSSLIENISLRTVLRRPLTKQTNPYFYPGDIYDIQAGITSIKKYFPFIKIISISVMQLMGNYGVDQIMVARVPVVSMALFRRLQSANSFASEATTTIERELEVLGHVVKTISGLVDTNVEYRTKWVG